MRPQRYQYVASSQSEAAVPGRCDEQNGARSLAVHSHEADSSIQLDGNDSVDVMPIDHRKYVEFGQHMHTRRTAFVSLISFGAPATFCQARGRYNYEPVRAEDYIDSLFAPN